MMEKSVQDLFETELRETGCQIIDAQFSDADSIIVRTIELFIDILRTFQGKILVFRGTDTKEIAYMVIFHGHKIIITRTRKGFV